VASVRHRALLWATHLPKHTTVNGVDWEYNVGGGDGEAVRILPGDALLGV